MKKDIIDIIEFKKRLPNTDKIVSDLQNLNGTIDSILQYVKTVEDENSRLKSELIDLYKKLSK